MRSPAKRAFKTLDAGYLYKGDLPDDAAAKMLDHDAPISKQSEAVQNVARSMLREAGYLKAGDDGPRQLAAAWGEWKMAHGGMGTRDGQALYDALTKKHRAALDAEQAPGNVMVEAQRRASEDLRAAGVPGIRYFDEFSRGDRPGKKTRNFVLFDDSLVKLEARDGVPLGVE
jgi:hypothetical protein